MPRQAIKENTNVSIVFIKKRKKRLMIWCNHWIRLYNEGADSIMRSVLYPVGKNPADKRMDQK